MDPTRANTAARLDRTAPGLPNRSDQVKTATHSRGSPTAAWMAARMNATIRMRRPEVLRLTSRSSIWPYLSRLMTLVAGFRYHSRSRMYHGGGGASSLASGSELSFGDLMPRLP